MSFVDIPHSQFIKMKENIFVASVTLKSPKAMASCHLHKEV
jgi:hypothetical protein